MPSKVSPRRKACLLSISLFIFHYKITPSLSPYANKQHTHTQIQKCTKCTTRTLSLSLSLCKKTTERESVCQKCTKCTTRSLSLSTKISLRPQKAVFLKHQQVKTNSSHSSTYHAGVTVHRMNPPVGPSQHHLR